MELIVNADDFGLDENSTKAIMQCFQEDLITQTTLMVNMPWCDRAVSEARKAGCLNRIGLHVNLSEGFPLSEPIKSCPHFCDDDGCFNGEVRRKLKYRFFLSRKERKAVEIEIRAQMEKFMSLGLPMRHCDSHGHVGAYLSILPIFLRCATAYGFKSTRIWLNITGNHLGAPLTPAKRLYCRTVERLVRKSGLSKTDYLGYAWDLSRIPQAVCADVVVEVLCHPNYRNENGEKDMIGGELRDWKTSYRDSIGAIPKTIERWTFSDLITR